MTNSIIHEVRAVREEHAASFDFDLDRIFADLQARPTKHAAEGWTIIPAPVGRSKSPSNGHFKIPHPDARLMVQ